MKCDELKVYHCNEWHNEYTEFYLKSDVDSAIAELEESHKKEVDQLLIEIVYLKEKLKNSRNAHKYWRKEYLIEYKECCNQKYKRCLDKAERCRLEQERIELIENQDITDDDFDKLAKGFYEKWRERWLKIVEQFKEANG